MEEDQRRGRPLRSDAFLRKAMETWGGSVYRLALVHTGSRADAEDVYQDVFIRLAQDTTRFHNAEHLKAWLLRVTTNRCHDLARSAKRRPTVGLDELSAEPIQPPDRAPHEHTTDLWEAVETLPESMRPLIHLFYYEGYSGEEIAHLLNLNPSTVRTRLQRARAHLKAALVGGATDDQR